jgi:hypothetical protein
MLGAGKIILISDVVSEVGGDDFWDNNHNGIWKLEELESLPLTSPPLHVTRAHKRGKLVSNRQLYTFSADTFKQYFSVYIPFCGTVS